MSASMDTDRMDSFVWVDWLIAERERLDMTQADLAHEAGLTRATISDYELRKRPNPDIRALVKISRALGHNPLWLPRLAGLIPAEMEIDQEVEDIIQALEGFTTDEKREILAYINFQRNQRKR